MTDKPTIANLTTADDALSGAAGNQAGDALLPVLTIASHVQADRVGHQAFLLRKGDTLLSRMAPDFCAAGATWGRPLEDPFLSRKPIVLTRLGDGVCIDNRAVGKRLKVNGEACPETRTATPAELAAGVTLELGDRICLVLHLKKLEAADSGSSGSLIGVSSAVQALQRQIRQVADLSIPVILLGASGTGKELVAAEIAAARPGPYVRVNMAAVPPNLAASELFGVVRGAFTGAVQDRPGFFVSADQGTLFLDEIGEIPSEVQPLLLRALECGEIQAVGARTVKKVQVRIVAATDAGLEAMVAEGRFKAPLLHRLSGFVIKLPALRARAEDVGLLAVHFARPLLRELARESVLSPHDIYAPPWMPAGMAAALVRFVWPGNVRQLRNTIQQLVVMNRDRATLTWDSSLRELLQPKPPTSATQVKAADLGMTHIKKVLKDNRYDIKATAVELGVSRAALYRRIDGCPEINHPSKLTQVQLEAAWAEQDGQITAMVERLEVSKAGLLRRLKEFGIGHPPA